MGGGGPSGTSQTTSKAEIPEELKPLFSQTGAGLANMQTMLWPGLFPSQPVSYAQQPSYTQPTPGPQYTGSDIVYEPTAPTTPTPAPTAPTQQFTLPEGSFLSPNAQQIAGLSPLQVLGMSQIPGLWGTPQAEQSAYQMAMAAPAVGAQVAPFSPVGFNPVDFTSVGFSPVGYNMPTPWSELSAGAMASPTSISPEQYASVLQSPGVTATQQAFEQGISPQIMNQMALSGLGTSSSLADALSLGWSQMLPGAVESEFGRMERGLEREIGLQQWGAQTGLGAEQWASQFGLGAEQWNAQQALQAGQWNAQQALQSGQWNELQRIAGQQWNQQYQTQLIENALNRQYQAFMQMPQTLGGLGAQETARELQAVNAAMQAGETWRGVEQQQYDAIYADFLRRQAIAEQSLFGPMGMFPSTIGQSSSTTSQQSGGGMFK